MLTFSATMKEFNQLTIYRSSAGSGKTYTLVKEYLKLALISPNSFNQILAITFTNKATDEMKSRIVKTLVEFTIGKSELLKKELLTITSLDEAVFTANAQNLLTKILHNYSDFAVCTIDSFFSRVIRSLSKEMGLPLKFDTEINTDSVISEISNRLLLDAGKNMQLTQWLEDFMISRMNEGHGWNIDSKIHHIAKELFKEDFRASHRPDENITKDFVNELRSIKNNFESTMKSYGNDFLKIIHENNLAVNDFSQKDKGVAGYMQKITRKIKVEKYEPNSYVLKAFNDPEKWIAKASPRKDEILSLVENKLRYILEDAINYYHKNFEFYISAHEVFNQVYIAGIVNKLDEKLREYRDENDLLLISDTNLLLKDFISGEDAPFIYEKTGNRYRHFMIDEFQDTSAFQWSNMLPLIENSLAAGSSAMMVGDAKQSIYRWRGGKMQLLLHGIQNDLKHYNSITSVNNLKKNFRSKKEIVDFNNSFFAAAPLQLPFSEISVEEKQELIKAYHIDEVSQEISENNAEGGYVEIIFFDKKEKPTNENEEELTIKETALHLLLQTLAKIKEQGYEPKDICILVRTNLHGNQISAFLFANGYNKIVSSESLLISKAPQIIFLIHVLKLLNNPDDKIARAECLNYFHSHINPAGNTTGHEVFSNVNHKDIFFNTMPQEFSLHFSRLKKLPLYELAEQLINIFNLNKRPDAYIQRFQDLVLEYLDKNPPSLSNFIEWWDEKNESQKCSVIVPSNENAIHIVSIHKSKGLQFPIVLMPFPDWELKPKANNILWVHSDQKPFSDYSLLPVNISQSLEKSLFKNIFIKEVQQTLIDNLNLLYVAFTRAEERLYLICEDSNADKIVRTTHVISKVVESYPNWENKIKAKNGIRIFSSGIETKKPDKINREQSNETSFEKPEIFSLKNYTVNPWQNKLVLAINKNKISLEDENTSFAKSNKGILIHAVFSDIIVADDANSILKKYVLSGKISAEQKSEIENIITNVLKTCEPFKWFSNEWVIKTEAEMILPDGSVIRPDRVMIKDKKVVLLDYKTGEEDASHEIQLNAYGNILLESGYESVEKYLLYVKTAKLEKI